jgi:uncharacterized protein YbjT (DUF2867 family)
MNIIVTGANGYIGRRLVTSLLKQGHKVTAIVRSKRNYRKIHGDPEHLLVLEADLEHQETLNRISGEYDCAYYLVHAMSNTKGNFEQREIVAAKNFRSFAERLNLKQTIYLGGIYNSESLSPHLLSRKLVEDELSRSSVPLTSLRSAIIVGSGSSSFEIIRDLSEKLPIMITPKWLGTKCQPIAIRDCMRYLVGVLGKEESYNRHFDIGGPDILTYKQLLLTYSEVRQLKRCIWTIPILTPRLSSYWLTLVTAVPYPLAKNLVDSLKNDVVIKDDSIKEIVPGECISYKDSIRFAFKRIDSNDVLSSWCDNDADIDFDSQAVQVPNHACFKDVRIVNVGDSNVKALERIMKIGGDNGWYAGDWLWEIRGYLDKLIGGVGLRRGRRNPRSLIPGDTIDFWRVLVANEDPGRLLLYAEMKLPGEAWLEIKLVQENGVSQLKQVATFRPRGLLGRLYWYSVLPLHSFIFPNMAKKLANAS